MLTSNEAASEPPIRALTETFAENNKKSIGGRRVLTPVVVCGNPCIVPQNNDPLISPLLTAAAATAAVSRGSAANILPQTNVPASESEKLTALSQHVMHELKAPRPNAADIESVICPLTVQQFRKAWWAGVRPTTCERTCRHRSKVCDAIQLCNDCTGYYCKWLSELVGIPVLKASGRVDALVFHEDPVARLYWERISKVVCCPKSTTKCLMCIRRYQLFTHFLPGNLLFRGLVHESVMKLHEEGFSVDMGLIRKVTRRHLERIAESMELQLPSEYFSSLQAYDIILRRGPLVDVLTNGLSSALAGAPMGQSTASKGSPKNSGLQSKNSGATKSGSAEHKASRQSASRAGVMDMDAEKLRKNGELLDSGHKKNCSSIEMGGTERLCISGFNERSLLDADDEETTRDLLARLSESNFTGSFEASKESATNCFNDVKEELTILDHGTSATGNYQDSYEDAKETLNKSYQDNKNAVNSSSRILRSRKKLKRPTFDGSGGGVYYSSMDDEDDHDFFAMLEVHNPQLDHSDASNDNSEITGMKAKKKRRRVTRRKSSIPLSLKDPNQEIVFPGYGFEHQLEKNQDRQITDKFCFTELANQFPESTESGRQPGSSARRDRTNSRNTGHATRKGLRGHTIAKGVKKYNQKGSQGVDQYLPNNDNVTLFPRYQSAIISKENAFDLADRTLEDQDSPLALKNSKCHSELNSLLQNRLGNLNIDDSSHMTQLEDERKMAEGGIRGIFWDPSKQAWCALLPLSSGSEYSSIQRKIICYSVRRLKSFSSARWNAVYERLKRNPAEILFISSALREELCTWIQTNFEQKHGQEGLSPQSLDLLKPSSECASTRDSVNEVGSSSCLSEEIESFYLAGSTSQRDIKCQPENMAYLLENLAKALTAQIKSKPTPIDQIFEKTCENKTCSEMKIETEISPALS